MIVIKALRDQMKAANIKEPFKNFAKMQTKKLGT